jgi:nucleoside-diphosphate-sugar epimerase
MAIVAYIASALLRYLRPDAEQLLTPAAIRILSMERRADISKAQRELGFHPTSIETAIQEAYDWFVARGVIQTSARTAGHSVTAFR